MIHIKLEIESERKPWAGSFSQGAPRHRHFYGIAASGSRRTPKDASAATKARCQTTASLTVSAPIHNVLKVTGSERIARRGIVAVEKDFYCRVIPIGI